ncbi:uncharacterized protein LOC117327030 [Pecten maximus]|uniref:uncharacterized protein LOC117327030 n=1 Tax=Pecten maximus TaxID=6579 RepID=UPI001458F5AC|nr:uncharacterized protein LOC117327030 [Pecten maximus]
MTVQSSMFWAVVLTILSTGRDVTSQNLACYDCEDTFTDVWDPYTDCQVRLDRVDNKTCLESEEYCLVERITLKKMTISIKRSCAKECWYGCRAKGIGVTQVMCTSCCQEPNCNVGNNSPSASFESSHMMVTFLLMTYFGRLFERNIE